MKLLTQTFRDSTKRASAIHRRAGATLVGLMEKVADVGDEKTDLELLEQAESASDMAFKLLAGEAATLTRVRAAAKGLLEAPDPPIIDPDPGPDPDPDPDPIPPWQNPAQEIHDLLDLPIMEAAQRAREAHAERIEKNPSRQRKTTSDDRNNKVPRHLDILFDQVWQWTFNRHLITRAALDIPLHDVPYSNGWVPVDPIPELSLYSNLELGDIHYPDAKWVIRSYNNYEVEVSGCTIVGGNELSTDNAFGTLLKEHFAYTETEGNYTYRNNLGENTGGHPAYNAYRPLPLPDYDASNRFFTKPTTYRIEDSVSINCDQGVGRGSFAKTLFNPGDFVHPGRVIMDGIGVYSQWDFIRSQSAWDPVPYDPAFEPGGIGSVNANAMGAFVVHHYDIAKHYARARAMGSTNTHPTESFELRNATIMKSFTPMPIGAIRGTKSILIEDTGIYADRRHKSPFIHIDDNEEIRNICPVESLVIRNVRFKGAGVRVHLAGGGHVDCPRDLVGKVAIWRPLTESFEVRDIDLRKVYGQDAREAARAVAA